MGKMCDKLYTSAYLEFDKGCEIVLEIIFLLPVCMICMFKAILDNYITV